jgi:hypothetical protein
VSVFAVVLVIVVFGVISVLRHQSQRATVRSATVSLTADSEGVRRELADGRTEEISWPEVTEVDVFTTRVGPHKPAGGAVVLYGDGERGCIVPLDRVADSELLSYLTSLPGLDLGKVITAIAGDDRGPTSAAGALLPKPLQVTTVCWRRPDDPADDDDAVDPTRDPDDDD